MAPGKKEKKKKQATQAENQPQSIFKPSEEKQPFTLEETERR